MSPQKIAKLLEKLTYISDSGHFIWKKTGKLAGSIDSTGYRQLSVGSRLDRVRCYAHQLAWFILNKVWPVEIDHINGVKHDNRPHNLRDVSKRVNNQNIVKPFKNNKTGYLGVSYSNSRNVFYANISYNGKKRYLGTFNTPEEAHQAYLKFKRINHAGCTL